MNKVAVAKELLAVARLVAGGWDRFSEDLSDILEAQIMMNKRKSEMAIFNIIKAKVRSDKPLADMMKEEGMTDRDLLRMIRSNLDFMV